MIGRGNLTAELEDQHQKVVNDLERDRNDKQKLDPYHPGEEWRMTTTSVNGAAPAFCTACGLVLDPAVMVGGFTTHPSCDGPCRLCMSLSESQMRAFPHIGAARKRTTQAESVIETAAQVAPTAASARCEYWDGEGYCGGEPARMYIPGPRCTDHSPAAVRRLAGVSR